MLAKSPIENIHDEPITIEQIGMYHCKMEWLEHDSTSSIPEDADKDWLEENNYIHTDGGVKLDKVELYNSE